MIEFDKASLDQVLDRILTYTKKQLKKFFSLSHVIKYIETKDFTELYTAAEDYDIPPNAITLVLIKSGADFLPYIDILSKGMFRGIPITSITIPKNIAVIDKEVFTYCVHLKKIVIEGNELDLLPGIEDDCPNLEEVILHDSLDNYFEYQIRQAFPDAEKIILDDWTFNRIKD